jgi:SulP family sulfate permease
VALVTLGLLLGLPKVIKKVPAPLIAITLASSVTAALHALFPHFAIATIGSRFHTTVHGVDVAGIPSVLPSPSLPWGDRFSFQLLRDLFPSAFAIAMLGAIESLLSAVIADGMTGTKHDPDAELVGLGLGNLLAPLFGGIAATGALARTATNIRAGARSPFAATTHAVVVLSSMVCLAPLVAYVPMASLAALLLLVAWNMAEIHGFVGVLKVAPKSDVFVLVTCFLLTVLFDMVTAISVGVVLAALLFMRRMADLTESRTLLEDPAESAETRLPKGVGLYEINGPLFFGAAQKAMEAIHSSRGDGYSVMILALGKVPIIDSTGLVALDNAIGTLIRRKKTVILAGPLPRPIMMFEKARLEEKHRGLRVAATLEDAVKLAAQLAGEAEAPLVVGVGAPLRTG